VELNAFMQLIVHTADADVAGQQARLRAAGLGVYPVGPAVKNLHTCTFCMGERVEGLPDARRLDAAVAGTATPFPVRVGFSGCSSNCGEALLRDIGVVRMDGGVYSLYVGGKAGSLAPALGQQVAEGVEPERLVAAVTALLTTYRQTARGRERFWKNVTRVGLEPYRQAVEQTREGRP
jgi:precorrin-3B C17-methyltransferase